MTDQPGHDSFDAWMIERYAELWDHYDRTVLTIAAGGLAISVTFVGEIFENATEKWAVISGWGALVVSVLAITASIFPSIVAHQRVLEGNDDAAKRPGRLAIGLSVLAGVGLAAGLGLLAWFAFKNL